MSARASEVAAARAARKRWHVGDRVVVKNGSEYDGQTGVVYCLPPVKNPWWLYTVNLDSPGEHDSVCCAWDEMELVT
jgi:hypothetical protein